MITCWYGCPYPAHLRTFLIAKTIVMWAAGLSFKEKRGKEDISSSGSQNIFEYLP